MEKRARFFFSFPQTFLGQKRFVDAGVPQRICKLSFSPILQSLKSVRLRHLLKFREEEYAMFDFFTSPNEKSVILEP